MHVFSQIPGSGSSLSSSLVSARAFLNENDEWAHQAIKVNLVVAGIYA